MRPGAPFPTKRLKWMADIRPSGVDKHSVVGEPEVRLCNYTDVYKNDRITDDMPLMAATASEDEVRRFSLLPGDVIITKDSETSDDIAVPAVVTELLTNVVCGYHLTLLRPFPGTVGRFLFWCLKAAEVNSQMSLAAQGVTRFGITTRATGRVAIPCPDRETQRAIADFLDRKTAKLDTLAAEQEALLSLLEEKRAATISHVVTKGLDPSAPTKDSDVEWLGRVPEHWQRAKLKHVGSIQGGAGFPDDLQHNPDERIPFFKVANLGMSLDGRTIGPSVHTVSDETAQLLRAAIIPAGSIVYAKIGAAMLLNRRRLVTQDSCIDNNMSALTVDQRKANRDWVFLWTQVLDFKRLANPGPVPSLSEGAQRELPILIPPRAEQGALVERVYTETCSIDALSAEARVSIALLRERRAALISAAVTGRLDVRAAASRDLGEAA